MPDVTSETKTLQKTCRLLYFGPGDGGKRANLRYIHKSLPRDQLIPVESADPERNIGFRVHHGEQGEWKVFVQSLDMGDERIDPSPSPIPPFDGVVFVVDSGLAALDQGLAALEALKAYLDQWGLDVMGLPVVLQYNGRDGADIMPVDQMESLINPWGLLSYPASTATGDGVRETLKAILGLAIKEIVANPGREVASGLGVTPPAHDPAEPPEKPGSTMPEIGDLGIDYGPPLPGTEIAEGTKARGNEIFDGLNPPVVVPVKIPRRLFEGGKDVKILLEVEIEEDPIF
jgi:hypothetical protein